MLSYFMIVKDENDNQEKEQ